MDRVSLAAASTSSGLSRSAARLALVLLMWAPILVVYLLEEGAMTRGFEGAVVFAAGLVGAIALTSRRPGPLGPIGVAATLMGAIACAALGTHQGTGVAHAALFSYAVYLAGLLLPRGNPLAGAAGLVAVFSLWATSRIFAQEPFDIPYEWLGMPVLAVCACLLWMLNTRANVRQMIATRGQIDSARLRSVAAYEAEVEYREDLRTVARDATPLLAKIATGQPADEAFVRKLTVAEGAIRDRLRSADLRDTALASAVAAARWRGVRVVLLGHDDAMAQDVPVGVTRYVNRVLNDKDLRSVTIRRLPPGRGAFLSVVYETGSTSNRVLLDEQGTPV